MSEKTMEAPTKITVIRTVKQKGHEAANEGHTETIDVRKFATEPAVVKFGFDAKKCQSFNSAGTYVGIELPCYVEEIDDAFVEARKIVRDRLVVELPILSKILDQISPE